MKAMLEMTIDIPVEDATLAGDLTIPAGAQSIILFAHGSGSSRFSSRNRFVAQSLQHRGLATLLFDLLTQNEEKIDQYSGEFRFDIAMLAGRLSGATRWIINVRPTAGMNVGYFGASTGAAAALIAENEHHGTVGAIVSRGGRPDLAGKYLSSVEAPTLFIVGGEDHQVIALNKQAMENVKTVKQLSIIPGATHLFEEGGALEEVARLAADWFLSYLKKS